MKQGEVLTLIVGDLLLKHMLKLLPHMGVCLFLSRQELLISLLLLQLIPPIIHPIHSIKMRLWDQPRLDLDAF